jgi:hypothetical protein
MLNLIFFIVTGSSRFLYEPEYQSKQEEISENLVHSAKN